MAVINVCELWRGRTGSWGEEAKRSYLRIFRVKTDRQYDGPLRIMQAEGLPGIGDAYADADGVVVDMGSRCRSIQPNATDDPWTWEVACEYDNEAGDPEEQTQPGEDNNGENQDQSDNPLNRKAKIRFTFERSSRPVTKAYNPVTQAFDLPVVNSADEAFDPPVEDEVNFPILTITRNEWPPPYQKVLDYMGDEGQGMVNSDDFTVGDHLAIGVGKARMRNLTIGEETEENGHTFVPVTYEIALKKAGWNPIEVLDQGMTQKTGGQRLHVETSDGQIASSPQLLDGQGAQLLFGADPEYLAFIIYPETTFADLGL